MTERKRIVVIGSTGSGKSSLCNVIAGKDAQDSLFPVGHDMSSKTWQTTVASAKWRGEEDGMEIDIIDTPGLDDPAGPEMDAKNIEEMVKKLKELGTVNLFFVVFNGARIRLDRAMIELLKIFQTVFGKDFLTSTIFGFSQWAYHPRAIKDRQKQNEKNEVSVAKDLNDQLRKHGLLTSEDVPAVFIDSFFEADEDNPFNKEKQEFDMHMLSLKMKLMYADDFLCDNFQTAKRDVQIEREIAEEHKKKAEEEKKKKKEAEDREKLAVQDAELAREKMKTEKEKHEMEKREAEEKIRQANAERKRAEESARKEKEKAEAERKRLAKVEKRIMAESKYMTRLAGGFHGSNDENRDAMANLYKDVAPTEDGYSWYVASYNPCGGFDNHCGGGGSMTMRHHGHNFNHGHSQGSPSQAQVNAFKAAVASCPTADAQQAYRYITARLQGFSMLHVVHWGNGLRACGVGKAYCFQNNDGKFSAAVLF